MAWLIAGLIIFLGVHSVRIFADDWRTAQIAQRGTQSLEGHLHRAVADRLRADRDRLRAGAPDRRWSLYTPPTWAQALGHAADDSARSS